MKEVDVVLISWAKDESLRQVTLAAINSIFANPMGLAYHIYVVETNKEVSYESVYENSKPTDSTVTTIHPDVPFGYHRYLNIGRRAGKSKYVALCNNDLTFERGWATKIIELMEMHPNIKSASPWCPQTQGDNKPHEGKAMVGYRVRGELAGWCIFQQRDIYDIYPGGELDEDFEFWYCDNDYAMTLQTEGIKHALVADSVVNHHEKSLGKTGSTLNNEEQHKITHAQGVVYQNKWQKVKQMGPR